MTFQYITNLHDNAPQALGVINSYKMLGEILQDGFFCYDVNAKNGYELTINAGASPSKYTYYKLVDSDNNIVDMVRLESKDNNTVVSDKNIDILKDNIKIYTSTCGFNWSVNISPTVIEIKNLFSSFFIEKDSMYCKRQLLETGRSNVEVVDTSNTRYNIFFTDKFIMFSRDYRSGSGAFYIMYSDENISYFNRDTGSTTLTSIFEIINNKNAYSGGANSVAGDLRVFNVDLSSPDTNKPLVLSALTIKEYIINNIVSSQEVFKAGVLDKSCLFFENEQYVFSLVPSRYGLGHCVLRFEQ